MNYRVFALSLVTTLLHCSISQAAFLYHHKVPALPGEDAHAILSRYYLDHSPANTEKFCALNAVTNESKLKSGHTYFMPILIYRYDGKSIRSTISDNNYQRALRIQRYNEKILQQGLRQTKYQESNLLWVPYHEITVLSTANSTPDWKDVLGDEYKFKLLDNSLKNRVYYLVAGHGGPDPGAINSHKNHQLCEDEYSYDVVLRLYKLIIEHGGIAEVIITDSKDQIRDDQFLGCDQDERCGGEKLPLNQLARLRQRVARVNQLYRSYEGKGIKNQTCISVHVDSRSRGARQDVFFCHYGLSKGSQQLAGDIHSVFAEKYRKHRANGAYNGSIESRNLFILKNTIPKAVLIELANIQNSHDLKRILLPSNRQALANWILAGLQKSP